MIAGHFGLAAGVKKFAPRLPLWSLFLATFWMDIIFMILSMFGLESFSPMDPAHPAYGEVFIDAQYTHSLAGAILISLFTGWLAGMFWEKKSGMVIGGVVFSHWVLDLFVHRPDLPILPGNLGHLPLLGLGLWQYPRISGTIELFLAIAGTTLYWVGAAKLRSDQRRRALAASIVTGTLLLMLFISNIFGL